MTTEPVTQAQLDGLARLVGGPIAALVLGLPDVDLRKGRGVLEGTDRCLWTRSGHRITISVSRDGGVIASRSKAPDPECPA